MKKIINGIIVVEGKSDVAFLNEFIDAEFVITNGSEISKTTIDYLKKAKETRDVFVLTDPDSPGKKIRDVLDQNIEGLKHCFINKENSIKHGKVGVAESTQEEVLNALQNFFVNQKKKQGNVNLSDLYKLGLTGDQESNKKRDLLSQKLHFGYCNTKTLIKRINNCGITLEDIKKLL